MLGPVIGAVSKNNMPSASLAVLPFCDRVILFGYYLRAYLGTHVSCINNLAGASLQLPLFLAHFTEVRLSACTLAYLRIILRDGLVLGVLNLATVSFQVAFPTAPPWFVAKHPGVSHWQGWNVTGCAAELSRSYTWTQVASFYTSLSRQ